jgi:hypothetical protein
VPRKQISKARVETLIDFNARIYALTHTSMQALGLPAGNIITGLASQAALSGISKEDFDAIVLRASKLATEFEDMARKAGVIT